MRTIVALFGFIVLALLVHMTSDNPWTNKRPVDARIVEKWEDWSGEAQKPYKVLFAVEVVNNRSITGPVTTTYYEKGYVSAQEYVRIEPGTTVRTYTTNYKDLGVPAYGKQESRNSAHTFWMFCLFVVWPIICMLMLFHWIDEY